MEYFWGWEPILSGYGLFGGISHLMKGSIFLLHFAQLGVTHPISSHPQYIYITQMGKICIKMGM